MIKMILDYCKKDINKTLRFVETSNSSVWIWQIFDINFDKPFAINRQNKNYKNETSSFQHNPINELSPRRLQRSAYIRSHNE